MNLLPELPADLHYKKINTENASAVRKLTEFRAWCNELWSYGTIMTLIVEQGGVAVSIGDHYFHCSRIRYSNCPISGLLEFEHCLVRAPCGFTKN